MSSRSILAIGGGVLAVLVGGSLALAGGYVALTTPCLFGSSGTAPTADAAADCFDAGTYLAYGGGGLAVVGVFSVLYGWIQYAYA